jgi:pimeloyl-ACP methyl ester carboxylesterase
MMAQNKNLTLVLLPGMDGTGKLFDPLLKHLHGFNLQVVNLPQSGEQDYLSLTDYVKNQLPNNDFILIAESFSGPIAAQLAQLNIEKLKGIVFVATFLSSPNPMLLKLARRLPIKLLSQLPLAKYFIKKLFLGKEAGVSLIKKFQSIVNQVPTKVLKLRMQIMQDLEFQLFQSTIPALYIQPSRDRLVDKSKGVEFQQFFELLVLHKIIGPHFILQSHPKECSKIILHFLNQTKTKR